jgi:nucleolar protein 58
VKLHAFKKFKETKEAVESLTTLFEGELPKDLSKFLKKNIISKEISDKLICYDKKIASAINKKLGINCEFSENYLHVFRGIREQLTNLIEGLTEEDLKHSSVGLSHNFYRYKLKFNVDKVDIMVIQAVGLVDDMDKELNNLAMRLREWYGWHFPEVGKLIADNIMYAKVVLLIGMRHYTKDTNLLEVVLDRDLETQIKEAAEISMGSEISEEDELNIKELCSQVIQLSEYRASLVEYLKARMKVVAPNLTELIGEMVAARLISHAGSLINLAKQPASTIQIFGAEKALFRALRTKHDTPKYGLIYHASIVGGAAPKIKGKISRSLASKCALCVRVDALRDNTDGSIGMQKKAYLEKRIRMLDKESQGLGKKAAPGQGRNIPKYNSENGTKNHTYNKSADVVLDSDDDEVPVKKDKFLGKKTKKPTTENSSSS